MLSDYPLASLFHAEYFLVEIRPLPGRATWIYQLRTLVEGHKILKNGSILKNQKDSLLSGATYLFIFTFGDVGSKATVFWLPALQRGNEWYSESTQCKS